MERKLNKERKISNYRVGKIRKTKNKIVIATEGSNKTEKTYFKNFEENNKNYSILFARGNNTDPLNMVITLYNEIKKRGLNLDDGDVAFCVFDTDVNPIKNKIINDAKEFAKDKGIQIITSTPCFELWFLLHYVYTTSYLSNKDVILKLKKYYSKYTKSENIFCQINDNVNDAIERAKKLEKYQTQNNKKIGTVEANPSTEVYKVVEYLMKNK